MGTIPIAKPTPQRTWRLSRRIIPLALLGLAALALIAVAVAITWPTGSNVEQPSWVGLTRVDDLNVNEPVRFIEQRLYLVKLDSGEILALSQRSTYRGCTVPWRPEFKFMGRTGWFRDPCHGATFDLTGVCYEGPCPRGLDRYEVRVEGGKVEVNLDRLTLGPPLSARDEPVNPGVEGSE